MESWYGILWKHKNRHEELLKAAERERLANELLAQQRAAAEAEREARRSKRGTAPAGAPKTAEQG